MRNKPNQNIFSDNLWNQKKWKLKKEYPSLSDTDLTYQPGYLWELINALSVKLEKTDQEIRELITHL